MALVQLWCIGRADTIPCPSARGEQALKGISEICNCIDCQISGMICGSQPRYYFRGFFIYLCHSSNLRVSLGNVFLIDADCIDPEMPQSITLRIFIAQLS